jgi:hypothetical protein
MIQDDDARRQTGQAGVVEPGRQDELPPFPDRLVQRGATLVPSPVLRRVLRRDEDHDGPRLPGVDRLQALRQVGAPHLGPLVRVIEAADPRGLQRLRHPLHVRPLGTGERQRHIPAPARTRLPPSRVPRHRPPACHPRSHTPNSPEEADKLHAADIQISGSSRGLGTVPAAVGTVPPAETHRTRTDHPENLSGPIPGPTFQ